MGMFDTRAPLSNRGDAACSSDLQTPTIASAVRSLKDKRPGFPDQRVYELELSNPSSLSMEAAFDRFAISENQRRFLVEYDLTDPFDYTRIPEILSKPLPQCLTVSLFTDSGGKWRMRGQARNQDSNSTQEDDLAACGYRPVQLEHAVTLLLGLLKKLRDHGHVLKDLDTTQKQVEGLSEAEVSFLLQARDSVLRTGSNSITIQYRDQTGSDDDPNWGFGLVRVAYSSPLIDHQPGKSSLMLGSPL